MKGSTIVGVNGITRLVFNSLLKLTGREIYAADSFEAAKKYLLEKA